MSFHNVNMLCFIDQFCLILYRKYSANVWSTFFIECTRTCMFARYFYFMNVLPINLTVIKLVPVLDVYLS